MNLRSIGIAASLVLFAFACSETESRSGFTTDKDPTEKKAKKGDSTSGDIAGNEGDDDDDDDDDDATNPGVPTDQCGINNKSGQDPNKDYDGDGFPLRNDCNECNKKINAGARDIPGNNIDEDCTGVPDDEPPSCDDDLNPSGDAYEAAAALGLCKRADKDGVGWGVISAKFLKPDGKPMAGNGLQVGVLPQFGEKNTPKEGKRIFVLSTGVARTPKDEGYYAPPTILSPGPAHSKTGLPAGFPKEAPSCQEAPNYKVSTDGNDGAGLEVKIRVPSNAKSFSYEHFFLTQEFPDYVCSKYNDFFVTLMSPAPAGLEDANIAFDSKGNTIGVNSGDLFSVCKAGDYTIGKPDPNETDLGTISRNYPCPDGNKRLKGTGPRFEGLPGGLPGGGTGWLTTTAPVQPGQIITLHFAVWDSADGLLDSTVFIDNFQFSLESVPTVDTTPTGPH
jgi:hypothetical protein